MASGRLLLPDLLTRALGPRLPAFPRLISAPGRRRSASSRCLSLSVVTDLAARLLSLFTGEGKSGDQSMPFHTTARLEHEGITDRPPSGRPQGLSFLPLGRIQLGLHMITPYDLVVTSVLRNPNELLRRKGELFLVSGSWGK